MDKYKKHESSAISIEEIQAGVNKWDGEHVQHQRGSEKDCRKKSDGLFPFFLKMNVWWHGHHVYRWLVKFHNGKNVRLNSFTAKLVLERVWDQVEAQFATS